MTDDAPTSREPQRTKADLVPPDALKRVLQIIGWLWAAGSLVGYFELPLPTHLGTIFGDPPYHLSWVNYSLDFLVWAALLYLVYRLWKPGLREILLVIGWFAATGFVISYTDFPFPVYVGFDWGRHFSAVNHAIDFLGWGALLYLLHAFWKPVLRLNRPKLISTLVVLTLALTALTLPFDSPLSLSWSTGGQIHLRRYEVPNHGAQSIVLTKRGLPYDFYYHSIGYSGSGEMLWDFVGLEKDTLAFDLLFWLAISLSITRTAFHRSIRSVEMGSPRAASRESPIPGTPKA